MIPALIAAGSSLLGGFLNSKSAKDNNAALIADKEKDRQLQTQFAQEGIQWKVKDAQQAGVHPLYALGANTVSYQSAPLSITPTNPGTGLAQAGQDISRAMNATRSAPDRANAFTKTVQDLSVQKMGLENQLLASQIAKINASPNPPMPINQRYLIDGQGQTASGELVQSQPLQRTPGAPGSMHQEPAAITDVGFARTSSGGYMPVPSKDVKERIEDNLMQEIAHAVRNNIMPMFGVNRSPPPVSLPKDSPGWVYDPVRGYRPGKRVPYTFGLFRY